MDPITTALVAALTAGVLGGDQDETSAAYEALKAALHQEFKAGSDLVDALVRLEKKPESLGRREVLQEEVATAKADQHPDLLATARNLLDLVNRHFRSAPLALQRPSRVEPFFGRAAELEQLLNSLQPGCLVAVSGPPGIGKSALVTETLWQLAPNDSPPQIFPDGIIYYSFHDQPRTDITLEHIALTFGESLKPSPVDAAERALANRQALLVLDQADLADNLQGLLTICGNCGVLVISRQKQEIKAEQIALDPLPPDEGIQLLQAWGGWQAKDEPSNRKICELVGGLPLAIRLAGQYMLKQSTSSTQYLAWLKKTLTANKAAAQQQQESISLLLEHSLSQVSETARRALTVAGQLALAPFDQTVVIEALTLETTQGLLSTMRKIFIQQNEKETPNVNNAIRELVDYGFLESATSRHQVSHPLIHTYAQQHLLVLDQTHRRLTTSYVSRAWEQSKLGPEGYTRLDADRLHLMKLLTQCIERKDWEAAYGLATAIEDYLDRQGYWLERVMANEAGLIAAWQLRRPSEGAWLGNLGDAYRTMGHAGWAIEHFEKALAIARQTGNRHSEGNSLGNLGLAYRDLGQLEQAKSYLEQSLAIFERINSPSASLVRDWLAELEEEQS